MNLHSLRKQVAIARRELAQAVSKCGTLSGEVVRRYHVRTLRDAGLLPEAAAREFAQHVFEASTPWGSTAPLQDRVMPYLGYGWDGREWVPGGSLSTLDASMAAGTAAMVRHLLQLAGEVTRDDDVSEEDFRLASLRSQLTALEDLTDALRSSS